MSNDNGTSAVQRRGLMLVLSSPSGAGKTTLSRQLLDNDKQIQLSVSATTRARRASEKDGVDYRFVDTATFNGMMQRGEFLEHARVFDHYYGTPRGPVEAALKAGRDVLFDIDWQGTQQLQEKGRDDLVTVFILPPSIKELRARLERRAQDSKEAIGRRLKNAKIEMGHYGEYDYVIVNEDLEVSTQRVRSILAAARLARPRLTQLDNFVRDLQNQIDAL